MRKAEEVELNVAPLDDWIRKNNPSGREKLVLAASVSGSSLNKIMYSRRLPGTQMLVRLSRAVGVPVEKLIIPKVPRSKSG